MAVLHIIYHTNSIYLVKICCPHPCNDTALLIFVVFHKPYSHTRTIKLKNMVSISLSHTRARTPKK